MQNQKEWSDPFLQPVIRAEWYVSCYAEPRSAVRAKSITTGQTLHHEHSPAAGEATKKKKKKKISVFNVCWIQVFPQLLWGKYQRGSGAHTIVPRVTKEPKRGSLNLLTPGSQEATRLRRTQLCCFVQHNWGQLWTTCQAPKVSEVGRVWTALAYLGNLFSWKLIRITTYKSSENPCKKD